MRDLTNPEDWKIIHEEGSGPWQFGFHHICETMAEIGFKLHEAGMMPEVEKKPESTYGSMSERINTKTNEFIITAAGSHQGRLKPIDFIWVRRVDWTRGEIIIRTDDPNQKPPQDIWLVDAIFRRFPTFLTIDDFRASGELRRSVKFRPQIGAVIHTHDRLGAGCSIGASFSPANRDKWHELFNFIVLGR